MIADHVFNGQKKNLHPGTFHVFFASTTDVTIYDFLMDDPIIHGRPHTVSMMVSNMTNRNNPFMKIKDDLVTFCIYKKATRDGYFVHVPNSKLVDVKMSEVTIPVTA